MLTRKQYQLLSYLWDQLCQEGVPPSYDEMKNDLGLKSRSGVHRLILGLEERGYIRRLPKRARALEVIKLPENLEAKFPGIATERAPRRSVMPSPAGVGALINGGAAPAVQNRASGAGLTPLPLLGRIAAATPVETLRHATRHIEIPGHLVGQGDHFVLEVEGDSMVEEGIFDRDLVVISCRDTAETGHIVVALIDDTEVTLKRLRRRGNSTALEPANKNYETRIFGPGRVRVQGVLTGLVRRYGSLDT